MNAPGMCPKRQNVGAAGTVTALFVLSRREHPPAEVILTSSIAAGSQLGQLHLQEEPLEVARGSGALDITAVALRMLGEAAFLARPGGQGMIAGGNERRLTGPCRATYKIIHDSDTYL